MKSFLFPTCLFLLAASSILAQTHTGSAASTVIPNSSDGSTPFNQLVQFADMSYNFSSDGGWDFCEGIQSSVENPLHYFAAPDSYTDSPMPVPSLEIIPSDTLFVSLACGSESQDVFVIKNNGDSDLIVDLNPINDDTVTILAISAYVNISTYMNTFNAINQNFTNYNIINFSNSNLELLENQLAVADIVLIPNPSNYSAQYFYASISDILDEYVNNGGHVVICGTTFLSQLDIFNATYQSSYNWGLIDNVAPDHPIMQGISDEFEAANSTLTYNFGLDIQATVQARFMGQDVIAEKNIGAGKAIYLGFTFNNFQEAHAQIIGNTMNYLKNLHNELELSSYFPLVLAPSDSVEVTLTVNAHNLLAGEYFHYLEFESNDSENTTDTLVVAMDVSGTSTLSLPQNSVQFGESVAGTTAFEDLVIFNMGCETLVLEFNLNEGPFGIVGTGPFTVAPFSSETFEVSFSPAVDGQFTGTLEISGNGGEAAVQLIGIGLPAPEIEFNPADTLSISLSCGMQTAEIITVENTGQSFLQINQLQNFNGSTDVLALTRYVDISPEYNNTLNAINQNFSNYNLVEYSGNNIQLIEEYLTQADILLLPEQESTGANGFNAGIAGPVNSFLSSGGKVLICGSPYLQTLGVFDFSFETGYLTGSIQNVMPTHPIMQGAPPFFGALNTTYPYTFNSNLNTSILAEIDGFGVIAEKKIGLGTAVYVGFDFNSFNSAHTTIIGNAMNYLRNLAGSLTIDTDFPFTLPPLETEEVIINVDAQNLLPGNYYENILFETSGLYSIIDTITLHVNVLAEPVLFYEPTAIDFGELVQGFTAVDTIVFFNNGCIDIELTLGLEHEVFQLVGENSMLIEPNSSDTVIVTFAPEVTGSYNGILNLTGNGGNVGIEITGMALPAPAINFLPEDTLVLSQACGSVTEASFTIYNSGDGPLQVDLIQQTDNQVNILALKSFATTYVTYPNTLDAINQYFENYSLIEFQGTDLNMLQNLLMDADIVLIPRQDNSAVLDYNSQISDLLLSYLENGGTMLLCGSQFIESLGIFEGPYFNSYVSGTALNNSPSHPIMQGVEATFPLPNRTFLYNFSQDTETTALSEYFGYDVIAEKNIGDGKAIFLGFDFTSYSDLHAGIVGSTLNYLSNFSARFQVSTEFPMTIAPSDSVEITGVVNTENLLPGTYLVNLTFETNDPSFLVDNFFVQLNVTGQTSLTFHPDTINFQELIAGFSITDTVVLYNDGCEDLELELSLESEAFGLLETGSYLIPAFSSDTAIVVFAPEMPGSFSGNLIISGNGLSEQVYLTGIGLPAPILEYDPSDTLFISATCGAVSEHVFTIFNNGESPMEVNLANQIENELNVLVLRNFVDINEYNNTLNIIDEALVTYTLTEFSGLNYEVLEVLLSETDILLMPRQGSFAANNFNSNISNLLLNYLEDGGRILLCGSEQLLPTNIFEGSYATTVVNFGSIQNVAPIGSFLDGIPESFPAGDFTFVYNFSADSEASILATFNGNAVIAEKNIGLGKALYIGFDFLSATDVEALILNRAAGYLKNSLMNFQVTTDFPITIAPSDSVEITGTYNAENLFVGNYTTDLVFHTNDPLNTVDTFTVNVEVSGQALLAYQPETIQFEPLLAGFTDYDTIVLFNNGCENLDLTLTLNHVAFDLVSPPTYTIPPFSTDTVVVAFSPVTVGVFETAIDISSNGGTGEIALSGTGLPAPEIQINPADTLHISLPCGTTSTSTFSINNIGAGNLELDLNMPFDGEIDVLGLATFNNINFEYTSTINAINQYFGNYSLTTYSGSDLEELEEMLSETDILLIAEQEGLNAIAYNLSIAPLLNDYLVNGGLAIICGSPYINEMGIFQANFIDDYYQGTIQNLLPEHPVMEDVPTTFPAAGVSYSYNFNPDEETDILCTLFNQGMIAEKPVGNGKAIYIGFDYSSFSDVHARIIGNAMNYLAGIIGEISVEDAFPLTLAPDASTEVSVTINAENLYAGEYYHDLWFTSNDPENTQFNYVLAISVVGSPSMEISENEVVFQDTYTGQTRIDSIIITNNSCSELWVNGSIPGGFFSVVNESITLEPYSSQAYYVEFAPFALGAYSETLTLTTAAGNFSVLLSGQNPGAPSISYSPQSISLFPAACADSVLVSFEITNSGEGPLEVDLNVGGESSLQAIRDHLSQNSTNVTSLIQNVHYFLDGHTGNSIDDGGNDMYDGGNFLSTNLMANIAYTNSQIILSSAFGDNSRYFTSKTSGLFVMGAEDISIQTFSITGNLGADGEGSNVGDVLSYSSSGFNFKGFVTRTSSTDDPTINHLIIVEDLPSISHSFLPSTNLQNHTITGLSNTQRIFYLLFSSSPDSPVSLQTVDAIFSTFVDEFILSGFSTSSGVQEVEPGETVTIEMYIPLSMLDQGIYNVPVEIASNDPINPLITANVEITINDTPCPHFTYYIDESSLCNGTTQFINLSTNNPQEFSWDFGDGSNSTEENPIHTYQNTGVYEVTLTACSFGECFSTAQTLEVVTNGLSDIQVQGTLEAGELLVFTPIHEDVSSFNWNFGDGTTTGTNSPTVYHAYLNPGVYEVVVSTSQSVCSDTASIILNIQTVSAVDDKSGNLFAIYPNPSKGNITIEALNNGPGVEAVDLYDALGKRIATEVRKDEPGLLKMTVNNPVAGMYILEITTLSGKSLRSRIVLE